MHIIILGAPGAGKGTQADIISKELDLPHISSGDLFRRALEEEAEIGLAAKSYMERGLLVPDDITIRMILERLSEADCTRGCVLDGFPRNLHQARVLDESLERLNTRIDRAVYIEVPEEELVRRLSGRWLCRDCQTPYHEVSSPPRRPGVCDKCGGSLYQRPDDSKETIRERLGVFFAETAPLLEHYEKQSKLIRAKGNLGIREVAKGIISSLRAQRSSESKNSTQLAR